MPNVDSIFNQMKKRRLDEEMQSKVPAADTSEEAFEVTGTVTEENTDTTPETPAEPTTEVPAEDVQTETPAEPTTEVPAEEVSEENLDEATKKVVRDGEVVTKKVSTVKKRLTSAQKAALAKARKKAHTASANKARAKSNKVRNSRGLNSEDTLTCPGCGFEGTTDDFDEEDGVFYCPECGEQVASGADESVDVAELAVRLDECNASDYMKQALNDGKYEMVKKYLAVKEGE